MALPAQRLTLRASNLAFLATFLWGGMTVSVKIALPGVPPFALAGFRFGLGMLVVLVWACMARIPLRVTAREAGALFCLTLLFVVQMYLLNYGIQYTLAGRSCIFISTHPFFIALFAHFVFAGDRLSRKKIAGMVLSFAGIVIIFSESLLVMDFRYLAGDLIVIVSSILLALRTIYTKHLIDTIHPETLLLWMAAFSVPLFFLLSLIFEGDTAFRFSTEIVAAILYQGVIISGFVFILWTNLLRRYMASRLGVFHFATPLFGILLSYLVLGEAVSHWLLASMLLVGAGIAIVNWET